MTNSIEKCPKCGGEPGKMYFTHPKADCKDCHHRFKILLDGLGITPIPHEEAGCIRNWTPPETSVPSIHKVRLTEGEEGEFRVE